MTQLVKMLGLLSLITALVPASYMSSAIAAGAVDQRQITAVDTCPESQAQDCDCGDDCNCGDDCGCSQGGCSQQQQQQQGQSGCDCGCGGTCQGGCCGGCKPDQN